MDITVRDYFCSKYVMGHEDIAHMIDEHMIDHVQNVYRIANILDQNEREHQEALVLWDLLSPRLVNTITQMFNEWINTNDEKKSITPNEEKNIIIKFERDECTDTKKKNRKLVSPIMYPIDIKNVINSNNVGIDTSNKRYWRVLYMNILNNTLYADAWKNIDIGVLLRGYLVRDMKYINVFRHLSRESFMEIKKVFPAFVYILYYAIAEAHIYDNYPTFKNHVNLAAYITIHGHAYCTNIIKNMDLVCDLIEKTNLPNIWENFMCAYIW